MKSSIFPIFAAIVCISLVGCGETKKWDEEVTLLSHKNIIVTRTVEINYIDGPIWDSVINRSLTTHTLAAVHPFTGKKFFWRGPFGLNPILLEFSSTSTFLVALPMRCDAKIDKYSLIGFPYIFMTSENGKNWLTVAPDKFPAQYQTPNLSVQYDYVSFVTAHSVNAINGRTEDSSGKFLQRPIPRSPQEWQYQYKSEYGYKGC